MAQYALICNKAAAIKKKYGTDVFEICKSMGINLLTQNMGCSRDAVKGFFMETHRIKAIVLNADLPEVIQRIIVAHELGHAVLHKTKEVHAFHDVAMFDDTSLHEKEANLFAAELLLDDKDVLEALNQDMTFFSAAANLMVPVELLDFKFRVLKWKGYAMTESPIIAESAFLKGMQLPEIDDGHIC